MKRSYQFGNSGTSEIIVTVEPWVDTIPVAPGSKLVLHCESNAETTPTIEPMDGGIWFWPECDMYTAEIDGEPFPV